KNFIYEFDEWIDNHIYVINFDRSERG
ncbi:GNAT family N-acetyltransferase, partial [Staphylococcus pseudintermedius]